MLKLIVCALALGMAHGLWFDKDPYPNWNKLSITFRKFNSLPMSEQEAKADGWTPLLDGCKNQLFFAGKQYVKDGEMTTILLFNKLGEIAGIQFAAPKTLKAAKNRMTNPFHEHNGMLYLTAYFSDVAEICAPSKPRKNKVVGTKLLIQTSPKHDVMPIPLKEKDVTVQTNFKKGRCFYGMGQHYWYGVTEDMDCEDFYPVFLLYNGGELNAFGWATAGFVDSPRVEHPPNSKFFLEKFFFPEGAFPKCIAEKDAKERKLTTQHIYFQKRPYLNFC